MRPKHPSSTRKFSTENLNQPKIFSTESLNQNFVRSAPIISREQNYCEYVLCLLSEILAENEKATIKALVTRHLKSRTKMKWIAWADSLHKMSK